MDTRTDDELVADVRDGIQEIERRVAADHPDKPRLLKRLQLHHAGLAGVAQEFADDGTISPSSIGIKD